MKVENNTKTLPGYAGYLQRASVQPYAVERDGPFETREELLNMRTHCINPEMLKSYLELEKKLVKMSI